MTTNDALNPLIQHLLTDPAVGVEAFQQIPDPTPSDLFCVGLCYFALNRLEDARKFFQSAQKCFYEAALLGFAMIERENGEFVRAVSTLRLLQFDRLNLYEQIIANREMGMLFLQDFQPMPAHLHLTRAWATALESQEMHILLPNIAFRLAHLEGQNGNWLKSLHWANEGLLTASPQLRPYLLYRRGLAQTELNLSEANESIDELKQYANQSPHNWNYTYLMGYAAQKMGNLQQSEIYFGQIVKFAPEEYRFYALIKQITLQTPLERAENLLNHANQIHQNNEMGIHAALASAIVAHLKNDSAAPRLAQVAAHNFARLGLLHLCRHATKIAQEMHEFSYLSLEMVQMIDTFTLDSDLHRFGQIVVPPKFGRRKLTKLPSQFARDGEYFAAWEAYCSSWGWGLPESERLVALVSLAKISHLQPNCDELLAYAAQMVKLYLPMSAEAKAAYSKITYQMAIAISKKYRAVGLENWRSNAGDIAQINRIGYTLGLTLQNPLEQSRLRLSVALNPEAEGEYVLADVFALKKRSLYLVECELTRRVRNTNHTISFSVPHAEYHECFLN